VTQQHTTITEVSEDGLCLKYHPYTLHYDIEVKGPSGWLAITSHTEGEIHLAQESTVEVGDQISQQVMEASKQGVF
jgi:hypothetical protein